MAFVKIKTCGSRHQKKNRSKQFAKENYRKPLVKHAHKPANYTYIVFERKWN